MKPHRHLYPETGCLTIIRDQCLELKFNTSPTLRCVLQLRISCPQWVVFNGVKGQTSVIVQSDPSISIKGSLLLGKR